MHHEQPEGCEVGRRRTIPEESRTAFLDMINQGMSGLAASTAVGVSEFTGRKWAKAAGVKLTRGPRGGNAFDTAEKLEIAASMLEKGCLPREIGEYVGMTRANISLWRKQGPDKLRQRAATLRTGKRAAEFIHAPVMGPYYGPRTLHQVLREDYTTLFNELSSLGLPAQVCGALLHLAPPPSLRFSYMSCVVPLFADEIKVVGQGTRLSLEEKMMIQRFHDTGVSAAEIGRRLGRCRQTISRELRRGQDDDGRYRARDSYEGAIRKLARPKTPKLDANRRLRAVVVEALNNKLSPEQISGLLATEHANDSSMQISHETIYQALYVQGKGALRDELKVEKFLRTGRKGRKPQSKLPSRGKPWVEGALISQRPAEVADRAVPGHWEGDLVIGGENQATALVTLVERTSRLTLIKRLGVNHEASTVTDALVEMMGDLPQALRRSLTWDQGVEMAEHARFSVVTKCPVFFCDPHSPWQRGSNENTNGLVRDFFPKGTNFAKVSDEEVQRAQDLLNYRPRKMHGFKSAAQVYEKIVVGASTD